MSRVLRSIAAASVLVGAPAMVLGSPASAAPGEAVTDIRAGSNGVVIGTARFTRYVADGGQRLRVDAEVPGGVDESHLCLSTEPYTRRVSAGSCPFAQGATGSTVTYDVALAEAYLGRDVNVQFHIVSDDQTAYAGWRRGKPFYGQVAVGDPAPSTEVPIGAAGVVLLAGGLAVGLGLAHRRSRRPAASVAGRDR